MMAAKVRDLKPLVGGYEFKISGAPGEFARAIEGIKAVPKEMRAFDPGRGVWFVSGRFVGVLEKVFGNWDSALDAVESQLAMF